MAEILTAAEREWLLDALRELIAAGGMETFLAAPILEPTPRDFPDVFEPNAQGVSVLLRRVLTHAHLDLEVELDTFSRPEVVREIDDRGRAKAWGHEGTAAWFAGIHDGRCHFGIAEEGIDDPTGLVATLCHEVAHAWRAAHELAVEDLAVEERLTDLTTVYLGFGLLTTNGAYRYRQSGEFDGTVASTRWSHASAGYLPPQAMSFLLAAQVKARGLGWFARRRLAGRLEPNQAAYFRWAYWHLAVEEVRALLGKAASATNAA
jgi:hypothetical protein